MRRQTYRYSTKKVMFNSPNWKNIVQDLNNLGVYWFLTDPYDHEVIAVMVNRYDEQQFLQIVNKTHGGDFRSRELY